MIKISFMSRSDSDPYLASDLLGQSEIMSTIFLHNDNLFVLCGTQLSYSEEEELISKITNFLLIPLLILKYFIANHDRV
jgi:hypothetical protein